MKSWQERLSNHDLVINLDFLGAAPLCEKLVCVVGSRAMSRRGKSLVESIVPKLCANGVGIVSGLALGIDACAHRVAIESGGYTLAVLPESVHKIYPKQHTQLAGLIVENGGGLCAEIGLLGLSKTSFLRRNRILAGLADLVWVVEAETYSGSVSTANWALEQGVEVVVGTAKEGDVNSSGVLDLVADGAFMISEAEQILRLI
jgi:DNA processing protein